jgi:metal-responsive CopG/Arc/MetJ family transcriptional regulator
MAADKSQMIVFKVDLFTQLSLDAHAKQMNVSRSEYCRITVREKLEHAREERKIEKQDSELQIIMSMLNTMNNHLPRDRHHE